MRETPRGNRRVVNDLGLDVAFIFHQAIENINRFSNATGDEMRKEGNVFLADHIIGHASIAAVTNVILTDASYVSS